MYFMKARVQLHKIILKGFAFNPKKCCLIAIKKNYNRK